MAKKKGLREVSMVRSSAAEYLTFIAATGEVHENVELRYEKENLWLTQKMMARLYDVDVRTISYHLKKIFEDGELQENSVIQYFWITASDGKKYQVTHYNLHAVIAVGFKVNSERAVQFRKWVNRIAKDYTIQGWVMDEERLKKGGTLLDEEFFERQLAKVREIRLSERKFYQKITDIYATAIDYDPSAQATRRFFAAVQNKLHYSVHGNTAAEIIYHRANAEKENMGLTTWDGAPHSKIHAYDVTVAKNYLTAEELDQLARIVSAYLDLAELQAKRKIPMTMADWEERLNGFLRVWDRDVLNDKGRISAELAQEHALCEFEKYRVVQDALYTSDFDAFLLNECPLDEASLYGEECPPEDED